MHIRNIRFTMLKWGWLMCILLLGNQSSTAQKLESIRENIGSKVEALKDTLASKTFTMSGTCTTQQAYTVSLDEKPNWDYFFTINMQGSYKGIKLPFTYTFSNGRSIYSFQGPSFRTPKFKTIGFSPNYKGYTLHVGNRSMDFSKYTYQQVRFEGVGFQTPEQGFFFRGFRGNLKLLAPKDLIYRSNLESPFVRKSWGALMGFKSDKIMIKGIVFKANDQPDSLNHVDTTLFLPKENTVLSYSLTYKFNSQFSIQVEQSLSALTDNALSPRIDILTPQTAYNLFGLFTKKESSHYYGARNVEFNYELDDLAVSFIHEQVDKNYHSLGSLLFDHNFIENRIRLTGKLYERLSYSLSGGLRNLKTQSDTLGQDTKIVFQSNLSYRWNDQYTSFATFNNFKTIQQDYYRGFNSSSVDSLSLSQANTSISFGTNYTSKNKFPWTANMLYAYQTTNAIQNDRVLNQNTKNSLITFSLNQKLEKQNHSYSISYISTQADSYSNQTISIAMLYGRNLSKALLLSQSVQFQSIHFSTKQVNQLILKAILELELDPKKSASLEMGTELSDTKGKLTFLRGLLNLDLTYKF